MIALSDTARGVAVSLAASFLFGVLYYYATLLAPLGGQELFGWRTLTTAPFLTIFMVKAGFWPLVAQVWGRIKANRLLVFPFALSSLLLSVQFWLFLWAPVNNRALEVSLGYLLMPLVMVLCGRVFFGEHLAPYQKMSVLFAALGVGNQVYRMGGLSWEMLVVALGFPAYFTFRRKLGANHLGGLWFDFAFMLPVAAGIICISPNGWRIFPLHPGLFALIPVLGLISALGVACHSLASRYLPLGLFGLLSYVEPVLLVAVSLMLGERIRPEEYLTYTGVCLAMAVLALGGARAARLHP